MKAIDLIDYDKSKYKGALHIFDWREFACGWGAAFVNITATYPIYKMIFRQV